MAVPPRYRYRWRWLALALVALTLVLIVTSAVVMWSVEQRLTRASIDENQWETARGNLYGTWQWLVAVQVLLLIPFIIGITWFVRQQKREIEKLASTEGRLRENEEIFQYITDHMSDFLAILDPQGRRIYNSQSYTSVLGSPEILRDTDSFAEIHPDDRERMKDVFRRTVELARGERTQYRLMKASGDVAILESQGNVICDAKGKVNKVIVVSRDITERDRAYQRLERQNATLTSLSHSPDLLGSTLERAFQIVTEAAANTLDVERVGIWFFSENLTTLRSVDLYSRGRGRHGAMVELSAASYPKYFAALAEGRCIAAHDVQLDERTAEFTNDYTRPLGITSMLDSPIRRAGRLVGVICLEHVGPMRRWTPDEEAFGSSLADLLAISLEVWDHRRTARALREAHDTLEAKVTARTQELADANDRLKELDRLKSEFLATMSHELRTPLNSILGFTGVLRQGLAGPLNDEQSKQLGMVNSAAKHLLGLITDLLDLSRIESGRMDLNVERFAVSGVINDVIESLHPLAAPKHLDLRAVLDDPLLEISADRSRLFQILVNLVGNAIKFTDRGHVIVTSRTTPDALEVAVTDTGIGIRAEQLGNLFQAFRQVDGSARRVYEGTGLGLYLSRQLLHLMGGEVSVSSTFGEGSTFSFTLPRRVRLASAA